MHGQRVLGGFCFRQLGQQLRQSGDLQKALQEFETAAQIDPSSFIAQQEIARTQAQISGAAGGGNTTQQEPKREDILRQRIEQAQGPVSLAPINDLSINMHISGDSKTIYQTIGKLAGINILFDPDYVARQLPPLELNGVTLQEALGIVSIQSGTFWRPVTPPSPGFWRIRLTRTRFLLRRIRKLSARISIKVSSKLSI